MLSPSNLLHFKLVWHMTFWNQNRIDSRQCTIERQGILQSRITSNANGTILSHALLLRKNSWLDSIPLCKQILQLLHFVLFIYFKILHAACSFRVSDKIILSCSSELYAWERPNCLTGFINLYLWKKSSVLHTATLLMLDYCLLLYAIILLLNPIHTKKNLRHQ